MTVWHEHVSCEAATPQRSAGEPRHAGPALLPGHLWGTWTDTCCICGGGARRVCSAEQKRHISSEALYADGLVKQSHTSARSLARLTLLLREKEVDPLGYGLASLGWEQSLLFGDIQHRLGHLIQRSFVRLQASGCVGVPCTELYMAILQRQEGHKEVNEVAWHQLALCKSTWEKKKHTENWKQIPKNYWSSAYQCLKMCFNVKG